MTPSDQEGPDDSIALTAALAEYEALRNEIAWLIEHSAQLQNYAIALSVGILPVVTFFLDKDRPAVLVGVLLSLPIALSLLGALYFRQHQEVFVVAAYIKERIRPIICTLSGRNDLWQWEEFKRSQLDQMSARSPIFGAWRPGAILLLRLMLFILPAAISFCLAVSITLSQGIGEIGAAFTMGGAVVMGILAVLDLFVIVIVTIRFARESDLGRIMLESSGSA
jgi:hypothetical protein